MLFFFKKTLIYFVFLFFLNNLAFSEIVEKIEITGNERISNATIEMFSEISINDQIDSKKLNEILKNLYNSNYFKNVSLDYKNKTLYITVAENPIIQNISYEGIKSNRVRETLLQDLNLKSRSSYNESLLKKDKQKIENSLKRACLKNI